MRVGGVPSYFSTSPRVGLGQIVYAIAERLTRIEKGQQQQHCSISEDVRKARLVSVAFWLKLIEFILDFNQTDSAMRRLKAAELRAKGRGGIFRRSASALFLLCQL
ncbi:putative 30S ribosomal protein S8 [Trichinella spiralis]|uniref:putative 30S ribosomal protein S8 n=1 Tax=Trichinella spiralis TaxID=6334 RepID=UPI0001EFE6BF|nr:putative 30S ribosomal protein S8 [Trichinella spiralis]